jgi:hypothetical protein
MRTLIQQDRTDRIYSDNGAGEQAILNRCDGYPEHMVPEESRTAEALGLLIRKLASPDLRTTARKFVMMCLMIDGHALGSPSLATASKQLGCTRQALSKINLQLQQELNLRWRPSKSSTARESYRLAQHRAVAKGTHVSLVKKKRKPKRNESL